MDCLWGWGMWKEREGLEADKPHPQGKFGVELGCQQP